MVGRGPFKRQSLKVLVETQIPISTIIDIGVLSGTPELMEAFPRTHEMKILSGATEAERRERRYDRDAEGRIFRAHRQCQPSQPGHIGGLVSVR
jgi:hypothetical protein